MDSNPNVAIIVAGISGAAVIIAAIINTLRKKEPKKPPDVSIRTKVRAKSDVMFENNNFGVQTNEGNKDHGPEKKN